LNILSSLAEVVVVVVVVLVVVLVDSAQELVTQ
jgi:hypothetical protein